MTSDCRWAVNDASSFLAGLDGTLRASGVTVKVQEQRGYSGCPGLCERISRGRVARAVRQLVRFDGLRADRGGEKHAEYRDPESHANWYEADGKTSSRMIRAMLQAEERRRRAFLRRWRRSRRGEAQNAQDLAGDHADGPRAARALRRGGRALTDHTFDFTTVRGSLRSSRKAG